MAELAIALDRKRFKPFGLFGGLKGQGSELLIDPGTPEEQWHVRASGVKVTRDSRIRHHTTGGGYGNPHDRDPERVAEDCRNESITTDDARDIYAVALDPARGDVDEGGTAKLRS